MREVNQLLTVLSVSCLSDLPGVSTLTLAVEWSEMMWDTTDWYVDIQLHFKATWEFIWELTLERDRSPVLTALTELLNKHGWRNILTPSTAVSCPLMFLEGRIGLLYALPQVFRDVHSFTTSYIVQERNCSPVLTLSKRLLKRLKVICFHFPCRWENQTSEGLSSLSAASRIYQVFQISHSPSSWGSAGDIQLPDMSI